MTTDEKSRGLGGLGVVLAFAAGALAGAAATILLAPRSGPETRRRIAQVANRSRETVQRVGAAASEAAVAARSAFERALNEASEEAHTH